MGAQSAGKTTSFYMIVGMVAPETGRVIGDETDITPGSHVSACTALRYQLPAAGAVGVSQADPFTLYADVVPIYDNLRRHPRSAGIRKVLKLGSNNQFPNS